MSPNPKAKFIVRPDSEWYNVLTALKTPSRPAPANPARHNDLFARATELHTTDCATFRTSSASDASSSEALFLQKILNSGTLSDRLSALTLLVQSSPIHNVKALEMLKGLAERGKGKGGREESLKALRCVVDWWVGGGAPARKLKYFRDQPLTDAGVTDAHLVVWYFEDWLKKYFFSVLQILESLSLDPLPYVRTQALNLISTLLREKPEQEQNLLRLLVNKLGDNEKQICSKVSYHLLQLLQVHPSMKAVIVREVISLVLRPVNPTASTTPSEGSSNKHIRFTDDDPPPASTSNPKKKSKDGKKLEPRSTANTHARYYATITFNQIVLTSADKDRDVARQLIEVYFTLFKEVLGEGGEGLSGEKGEADVRGDDKADDVEVKKDKKGRIRSRDNSKKGKSKRETKGAAGFAEVEDANSKLVSAILTGVNRAMPFARIDKDDSALSKHIDTLFLITHKSTFNISLQALVLIQQTVASLLSARPALGSKSEKKNPVLSATRSITTRYYRTLYASLYDSRLTTSSKQAMYLNLLFKSIKGCVGVEFEDGEEKENGGLGWGGECVMALVRRFVQVLVSGGGGAAEFVAGGLFLLGELFSTIPGLREGFSPPKSNAKAENGEEYDPKKRDPQYAHASTSPIWELTPLVHHYHPAIALHARQLLSGTPLTASADLSLNTLSHFLDRFVYKNAKKLPAKAAGDDEGAAVGARGASLMQPAASALDGSVSGVKLIKGELAAGRVREMRVNESGFLKRRVEDVPVDQIFFHKFFMRKRERERAKAAKVEKRRGGESDEDESEEGSGGEEEEEEEEVPDEEDPTEDAPADSGEEEGSELDEDEVWKAMKASIPKTDGDDRLVEDSGEDSEDDEIPSGLDDDSGEEGEADVDDGVESKNEDRDGSVEALSLAEESDNEDLLSLDAEVPPGLIEFDGSDDDSNADPVVEGEEWGGIRGGGGKKAVRKADNKRKRREESSGAKRKKLRALPTFASYEEYAKVIEDGPEDNI